MPTITASRPFATRTVTAADGSWASYDLPGWVRKVTVQSPPTGGTEVAVSSSASGAYAASDDQVIVPAGGSVTVDLTAGRAQVRAGATVAIRMPSMGDVAHLLLEGGG